MVEKTDVLQDWLGRPVVSPTFQEIHDTICTNAVKLEASYLRMVEEGRVATVEDAKAMFSPIPDYLDYLPVRTIVVDSLSMFEDAKPDPGDSTHGQ